ncbi:hypothetical protein [Streptomyces olivaceus]|uniref:hypothetical protein n=1 Tax=Streptomyces olivaceus TaxID=47716 RepID=UPI00362BCD74
MTSDQKTRGECPACGLIFQLTKDGVLRRHHGMTPAGFSTGERCPGVGEPLFIPEGA